MSKIMEEMDYYPRTYLWGVFTVFFIISIQLAVYYVVKLYRKTEKRKNVVTEKTNTSQVSEQNASSSTSTTKPGMLSNTTNDSKSRATRRQRGQWRGGSGLDIIENPGSKKKSSSPTTKSRKCSKTTNDAKSGGTKQKRGRGRGPETFEHPCVVKNLKGHTGTVLDADIAPDGNFLAAACEEMVPEERVTEVAEPRPRRERGRRQRADPVVPPAPPPPRVPPAVLVSELQHHLLSPEKLWALGYPLLYDLRPTRAVFYHSPPARPTRAAVYYANDTVLADSPGDSGRGSAGSSPRSDSDEEVLPPPRDADEVPCARCEARFRVTRDVPIDYTRSSRCLYHWGRAAPDGTRSCCGSVGGRGCSAASAHVWSGARLGMNGPLEGYVRARTPRGGLYALDAEMCYTAAGLEAARVVVVSADGRVAYSATLRPSAPLVDCNTRFSGVRERDIQRATKTLRDVQNDILGFIGSDTILVGHALENDLRALKIVHNCVVDTAVLYPHFRGLPWRRSLRALASEQLCRSVQDGEHSALEDARTALDLTALYVQRTLEVPDRA